MIISPHQTISASLGKDRVIHGGACNLKPGAPGPLCHPLCLPWGMHVSGGDPPCKK